MATKQIYQKLFQDYKEIIETSYDINKIVYDDDSEISNLLKQKLQQTNWWFFKILRYCNNIENSMNILTVLKNKLPEEEVILENQIQTLILKLNEIKTYIENSYEYRREKSNYAMSRLLIVLGVIYGIYYLIHYENHNTASIDQRVTSNEYLLGLLSLLISS